MKFNSTYCDGTSIYFIPTDDAEVNIFVTDDGKYWNIPNKPTRKIDQHGN